MATLTVYAGTEDGGVQSRTSTYSGARAGTGNLDVSTGGVADRANWNGGSDHRITELFFSFDTSSVPSGASISDVTFSLNERIAPSEDDNPDDVYVRQYDWGTSVTGADWRPTDGTSSGDTLLASLAFSSWGTGYNDFVSESAFTSAINTGGDTRFYCVVSNAEAASAPTGSNYISVRMADESGTSQDPKLVVTYTSISISSVTPSEFADGDTGVTIDGSGFEASQGTGKVELGDNSDYASATLVEQTVTSWSDTSIDFTVVQGALDSGTVYVFVTNDGGSTTSGFAATLVTELAAVVVGASSVAGTLSVTRGLAAQSSSVSTAVAALSSTRRMAATANGTSTAGGALTVIRGLRAESVAASAASADLLVTRGLSAQSSSASAVIAALTVDTQMVEFAASIAGSSSASASLSTTRALSAASAGTSAVAATLTVQVEIVSFTATVAVTSSASAALSRTVALSASAETVSSVAASLGAIRLFAADTTSVSTVNATLSRTAGLTAAISAPSTATATMTLTLVLAALVQAHSGVTASLAGGLHITYVPPGVAQTTPPPQPGHIRSR